VLGYSLPCLLCTWVSLSGMTCAKGGAKTTTLSDWGQGVDEGEIPLLNPKAARLAASVDDETEKEESEDDVEGNWEFNDNPWSNMWEDTPEERDTEPQEVLRNLRETVVLNDCRSSCSVAHLDWHSSLAPGFLPDRTFDVVVGSDLIYYQSDAEALATTIATHTAAHGAAYIMCHRGRSGLKDMIRILGEKGKVKKEKYVIVKSSSTGEDGKVAWDIGEKVMLFTFRHHMD
jgi:predicted nicotinamide N-methyase